MAQRYRLKLSKLQFCSIVDEPAQPNAKTLLIKRKGERDEVTATARLAKVNDELGLAFFWAFTSTNADGSDHFDLHGDTIDQDFVKVAMEFMTDGGGASDEMHDGNPNAGRVVFAMPMTPEIAAAFGIVSKHVGLMIAIKPAPDVLAKLKDGTYTGVSIGGLGIREAIKTRGAVAKQALVTTEVNGHQHLIDLSCMDDNGCGQTSYQTAEGEQYGHSHPWARGADGTISILADSGHTHELASGEAVIVVPADAVVVVAGEQGVAGRAPQQGKSTPQLPLPIVGKKAEESAMPDAKDLEIADLKKRNAELEQRATLNDAQRTHLGTLTGQDVSAFLAKSHTDRNAEIAKALEADRVVFKGEVTKVEVRKSHGSLALQLAQQNEQNAATIAKQEDEIRKARDARELEILKRRTKDEIGHLAGDDAAKVALLKAVDAIADENQRTAVTTALKAADAAVAELGKAKGVNPGSDPAPGDPLATFNAGVEAFAKKHNITDQGAALEKFLGTPEGRAAKRTYDETRAYGKHLPS